MTFPPDDPTDSAEAGFARRVRDYTERAVVPVDHAAIASAAADRAGPRRSGTGRFAWLFAGAAAIAALATIGVLMNVLRDPSAGSSPSPTQAAGASCDVPAMQANVGEWEGAAGHRIATLTLTNTSDSSCVLLGKVRPMLIDRNGTTLIIGKPTDGGEIELAAGQTIQALVQTGNYCGVPAQEPVTVRLDIGSLGWVVARPQAGLDSIGVPPCMGENGPTDDITIQPWSEIR
jgi:hypothetical protein